MKVSRGCPLASSFFMPIGQPGHYQVTIKFPLLTAGPCVVTGISQEIDFFFEKMKVLSREYVILGRFLIFSFLTSFFI